MDTLDHLPPLPLFIYYKRIISTEQDELGIYHAFRLHDRVCHIELELPPSILHKAVTHMDHHFPILEHLSLSFPDTIKNSLPLPLPKAFLAPNLRHFALPSISPPRRLRVITPTVSLVTLELSNIQTTSYVRPRLLVARLSSLPRLEELSLSFSIPIPRPSTERGLLGEQRAPVTLPSLTDLRFKGVCAYLESLVAQIRAPLLKRLMVTFFNQIAFALPHLFHLIDTEWFGLSSTEVSFGPKEVSVAEVLTDSLWQSKAFSLHVICKPLDWQLDCIAQICHAFIPALSRVEYLSLSIGVDIPSELWHGAIDSATWHDLLRSFIGVKKLQVGPRLLGELSRALQVGEVGSDPGFLPNLRSITAGRNRSRFASFIEARQVVGRPVQFLQSEYE